MERFKRRAVVLYSLILIWAVIVIARLFFFTIYASQHYVELGNEQAWRKGSIQAARGRILDADGKPLAWSEKHFDLFLCTADEIPAGLIDHLKPIIDDVMLTKTEQANLFLLKRSLSPEQLLALSEETSVIPGLKIEARLKRCVVDFPEVRSYIGNVGDPGNGGTEGLNGIENLYNHRLDGRDGEYVVMLNRDGSWIAGTYKMILEPIPGDDVILDLTIDQIVKKHYDRAEQKQ